MRLRMRHARKNCCKTGPTQEKKECVTGVITSEQRMILMAINIMAIPLHSKEVNPLTFPPHC